MCPPCLNSAPQDGPTNATTDASVPGNPVFRQLQYIYGEVRTLHYTHLACLVSEYGNIGYQQR